MFATALVTSAYAALAGSGAAQADYPGASGLLTGVSSYTVVSDPVIQPWFCKPSGECFRPDPQSVSWSPDGSRAVVTHSLGGQIMTVRYDDENATWMVADTLRLDGGLVTQRIDPTYVGSGDRLIWTEWDPSPTAVRRLMISSGTGESKPVRFSPNDGNHYEDADGGASGKVVFERVTPAGASSIWLWDGTDFSKITDGMDPSLSPDETKVAYICGAEVCTADLDGTDVHQLTTGSPQYDHGDHPTWSPDGTTIAYRWASPNSTDNNKVRLLPASGGAWTVAAGVTGKPAWRPVRKDSLVRLAGVDRLRTAEAVSQSYWRTASNAADRRPAARSVVLSRSDTFADALSGSALAAAKQGPLLMTATTGLNDKTIAEIKRVLGDDTTATVYLLGSTGALSATVENTVRQLGYQVKRLAGANRFATSTAIADEIDPNPAYILAATGLNFPDALSAGAAAGGRNRPGSTKRAVVVLTSDSTLPVQTKNYLDAHGSAQLFAIGRQAATAVAPYENPADDSDGWEIWGASRYETASAVADTFGNGTQFAGLATGVNWPDALAGGALLGTLGSPLLLTPGTALQLDQFARAKLSEESASISTVLVFGSAGVVSDAIAGQAATWISGPGGYANGTAPSLGAASAVGPLAPPRHVPQP
ncbi:hypothetical protein Cs7R123_39910 [Catellatospora sp. TT07R-123]|uniref:cell wall-binding repeat-containing protein n=1 Tax=Catellatospora sp. TT07R-123 TaxID=2733863 RepID=UPI001AFEA8D8|nr:cell wall-binding repeat-containing protein [Catellatospora sp. TT07R-123]GHJ46649.1 hypothetical protein Cs7R123_39910 [Catellatospora sp. TT07R-123]